MHSSVCLCECAESHLSDEGGSRRAGASWASCTLRLGASDTAAQGHVDTHSRCWLDGGCTTLCVVSALNYLSSRYKLKSTACKQPPRCRSGRAPRTARTRRRARSHECRRTEQRRPQQAQWRLEQQAPPLLRPAPPPPLPPLPPIRAWLARLARFFRTRSTFTNASTRAPSTPTCTPWSHRSCRSAMRESSSDTGQQHTGGRHSVSSVARRGACLR